MKAAGPRTVISWWFQTRFANGVPAVPRVKPYLLVPLGIALALLLLVATQAVERMQHTYLDLEISHYREEVNKLLTARLESDANLLAASLEALAGNAPLMEAFRRGDRAALLALAKPINDAFRERHGITHFYFTGPDRVNLLRVHAPDRHGDRIDRHTTREAERTGRTAWGIELGPLGLFTLRVVRPVLHEGRLVGYLELGEEIDHLLRSLRVAMGVDFYLTIDKRHLDRAKWEAGMALLGRRGEWDRFPAHVLVNQTAVPPAEAIEALARPDALLPDRPLGTLPRLFLPLPLADVAGRQVGHLLVGIDLSEMTALAQRMVRQINLLGLALGVSLFALFYWLLGRLQGRMRSSAGALREEEGKFRSVLDSVGDGVFGIDLQGRCSFVNAAGLRLLGYERAEDLLGRDLHALSHHSRADGTPYPAEDCQVRRAICSGEGVLVDDEVFFRADGRAFPAEYRAHPLRHGEETVGAVVTFRDVTERKHAEERLRLAATVYETSQEGMTITDAAGRIVSVNRAFSDITGYGEAEVLGRNPGLLKSGRHDSEFYRALWCAVHDTGRWQGEIWNRRKNGEIYPEWLSINAVRDAEDRVSHYVAAFSDITRVKESEERLEQLAHYDPLTGLPNRLLLQARLTHAIGRARREGHRVGLLYLDLDRFKDVNDSLGHPAGDELLMGVAGRLAPRIRAEDTLARMGGDEFVLLLEHLEDPQGAAQLAQSILHLLTEPFHIAGREVYIGASIGISLFPDDAADATQLSRNADSALYQAKTGGRNTYRFYTEALTRAAKERLVLETDLRRALDQGEFEVHYQPQVDSFDGRLVGAEALLRWRHPREGLVSPMRFIPVAEETGLIVPLGEWVLRSACAQAQAWLEAGLPPISLAVNLASRQFRERDLAERVAAILAETGYPAEHLELEITESAIMEQGEEAIALLRQLKGLGVSIAIDDFGTGYSSLAYLKRFPVDKLKVDRGFIRDIPQDQNDMEIAATIIAMARNLRLKVLAEGVETEAQLAFLQVHGCETYQGYLFSRPVPAEAMRALLARQVPPEKG